MGLQGGLQADARPPSDDNGADESPSRPGTGDDTPEDDTPEDETADGEAAAEDSATASVESATEQAPLVIAETTVDSNQARQTVATADAQATDRTVEELGLA